MKLSIRILLFTLFFQSAAYGQGLTLSGTVTDTLNYTPLSGALVMLIRPADSVLQTFGRCDKAGAFQLNVKNAGKYILRVAFPGFADYTDLITFKKGNISYGVVPMVSKEHLLKEFVLTQQVAAIKIKGDTTEYMADSFKVKDNATVEDLLKRLPGIQVDKNGQITAQGETVQKILVDGEEFFSDDPKVVTEGLQANVVKKVQVFDKKSDQTEFTGIDDGQKIKTINLELKEDKKKGYFGKIEAGGGDEGYFQNQAMINAFKAKMQASAFGIASNTDKVGLGWQDNNNFSSGSGVTEITDEGQVVVTQSNTAEDMAGWDGKYNGQGLPKVWTGGIHFADKWNEDKQHLSANVRSAMQNVEIEGTTLTQNPLPNNQEDITYMNKNQFSKGIRNGFDALYEWKIDSMTSLKLTTTAGTRSTDLLTQYQSAVLLNDADTLNTNTRSVSSHTDATFVNTDVLLRKKFSKKGRTLSLDVKENYKDNVSNGHLNSFTQVYSPYYQINTNQQKNSNSYTMAIAAKATYTEPLNDKMYLELNYGLTANNSESKNLSYDSSALSKKFDSLDKFYSSDYTYKILTNTGGAAVRFVFKHINFSVGTDISDSRYNQTNQLVPDSSRKPYDYFNYFPKATFVYSLGRETNLRFNYFGSTTQPTIDEISPLHQNSDPTNIMIGNTQLKQQFTNSFSLRFNNFKILSGRFLFASASVNTINNAISTYTLSNFGIRSTQYVNVDGNYNGFAFLGYGYKLTKLDMQIGAHLNAGLNHINTYINDTLNKSNNNSYTFTLDVEYFKDKKFTIEFNPSITNNDNSSNITRYSFSYWTSNSELSFNYQLPYNFEINTVLNLFLREKTVLFNRNNNVLIWNAYVSRKFLKSKQLELRCSVFDILDQNIGYDRTAQTGIITEQTYNTIRRHGMISLIWNFTHTPAGAPPPQGGGMYMMRR
jgi:hypothetical protein